MAQSYQPRESAYPTHSSDHIAYLEDCVTATESCVQILQSGIERLYPGIEDLPRLSKVLTNSHRYLVLPTPTITHQKQILSHTLVPQIENILSQAEQSITAQQGRIVRLEGRLKVVEDTRDSLGLGLGRDSTKGRLGESRGVEESDVAEGQGEVGGEEEGREGLEGLDVRALSLAQRKKVGILKAKRERLEREFAELKEGVEL